MHKFLNRQKASADGSAFITYNQDDYGMFGRLNYLPAGKHAAGTMRKIIDGDTNHYHGEIPEAPYTYAVMGYINEHQVGITETTFGGRSELADTNGIIDYVSLMTIALQRSRTAREAIEVMTSLVQKYGYASEGESFSIADPNEVWIMEMIGKGPQEKGAVWVAVRIPDDCIACHANQSRIHQFNLHDKKTSSIPRTLSTLPENADILVERTLNSLSQMPMLLPISVLYATAKHVYGVSTTNG